MTWESVTSKIFSLTDLKTKVEAVKSNGNSVVFTNGCFDLVHLGHLQYLCEASTLGDYFIVGVNADASVRALKGEHRPIKDEETRSSLLASLAFVDAVVLFSDSTPIEIITTILPDVLCKGGDWELDQIVGAKEVIAKGGTVKRISFLPGHSTTSLEQKIKSYI